jgi:chemotaxis protein methyltransferase CheR
MTAELSDDLYQRFRDLLLTRAGLSYPERKRGDLAHGLRMALGATRHQNLVELYADAIADGPGWEVILAHLTIGETYFFRNSAQIDALRAHILPELIARRSAQQTLRLWSAGCATGEEPYSLAMLLSDLAPSAPDWNISILASDINPQFLARAREALYGNWSFRETPETLRDRFWNAEHDRWRVKPAIRRMVTFARLNLAEPCYPAITNGTSALDLIVCRNVTIYFDEATTRQVITRFYSALTPGGWLVVGHAEPQASMYQQFEVRNFPNTVVYRKPLDAPFFTYNPASSAPSSGARPLITPGPRITVPTTMGAGARAATPIRMPERKAPPSDTPPASCPAAPAYDGTSIDRWPAIAARLAQGDKANAELLLHELLRVEPAHIAAHTALGRLYADRGECSSAQHHCQLALEQDALHVPAHFLLAEIHEHEGQYDAALAAYRRTLYLDPQFIPGMLGMANCWHQIGHAANAYRAYSNALRYLTTLPPTAAVPGINGVTVGDILALIRQQIVAPR